MRICSCKGVYATQPIIVESSGNHFINFNTLRSHCKGIKRSKNRKKLNRKVKIFLMQYATQSISVMNTSRVWVRPNTWGHEDLKQFLQCYLIKILQNRQTGDDNYAVTIASVRWGQADKPKDRNKGSQFGSCRMTGGASAEECQRQSDSSSFPEPFSASLHNSHSFLTSRGLTRVLGFLMAQHHPHQHFHVLQWVLLKMFSPVSPWAFSQNHSIPCQTD